MVEKPVVTITPKLVAMFVAAATAVGAVLEAIGLINIV